MDGGDGGGFGIVDSTSWGLYDPEADAREAARVAKEHEDFLASPAGKLYNQILAQGTTGKWSGEGFGGPEANAKVMASLLAGAGITDIRDFGRIEKTTYTQTPVQAEIVGDEYGTYPTGRYYIQDPEGVATSYVDPATVKTGERTEGYWGADSAPSTVKYYYTETPQTTTVFGNKKTGQEIYQNYNRVGGDVWQGTYAGHGRTNFGVQFAPDGTPYFYTQFGGDTSSMSGILPIVSLGLALFAPGIGGAIGSALTGTAATTVASQVVGAAILQGTMTELSGGDFVDGAIRGAVTAGAAPIVSQTVGVAVADAMGDSVFKNLVTNTVNSAATNAVVAGFTGGDVEQAALTGAIGGAAGSIGQELGTSTEYGTDAFTKQNQMLISQERGMGTSGDLGRIAGRTGASILMGADPTQSLISGLINASIVDDLSKPDTPAESSTTQTSSSSQDTSVPTTTVAEKENIFDEIFSYPSRQTANLSDGSNTSDLEFIDSIIKESENQPSALDVLGAPLTPEAEKVATDQSVFDQDNNLVNVIESEPVTVPPTVSDEDIVGDSTGGFNVITADDGSQLIFDANNNLVNVIEASDSPTTSTEISEVDYGAGAEKPTEFQGPMGPMTEDQIKRYNDEFAKYLDYVQAGEPPPPNYGVQDLGITDENWNSFNQNLLQMQEEGRLPTQWAPNEDGTFTFTSDDGSSITINDSGEITHYTEAPQGNLLTDIVTTPDATTTTSGSSSGSASSGGSSTSGGSGSTSSGSRSGLNFGSILSLLGGLGGIGGAGGIGSQSVSKPVYATDIPTFDVTKMFSPTLYAERQKYAKAQEQEENQDKQTTQYP